MVSRRQEKVARQIQQAVSDVITNHLSDPRIEGFISVTRVEVSADLRKSNVYLSVFGTDDTHQRQTMAAIEHARPRIQSFVASAISGKFCPVLTLRFDTQFKRTLDTMKLIDEVAAEYMDTDEAGDPETL